MTTATTPPEITEAQAAGARTWQLHRTNLNAIDDAIDRDGIYAKGYWQDIDGTLTVTGLRIGTGETRQIAHWGDWIIRQPDGTWTVHPAAAT